MKAFLIDAAARTVTEVQQDGLSDIQRLVGGYIEVGAAWPNGDVLYVDEEGLFKSGQNFFRVQDRNPQPIAGNGLVVGTDRDGETVDAGMTLAALLTEVEFRTHDQVSAWAKAHASEPAITVQGDGEDPTVIARFGSLFEHVLKTKE